MIKKELITRIKSCLTIGGIKSCKQCPCNTEECMEYLKIKNVTQKELNLAKSEAFISRAYNQAKKSIKKVDNIKQQKKQTKYIVQLTLNGNEVRTYRDDDELIKYGYDAEDVRRCCNKMGNNQEYKGYIWEYRKIWK